MIGNFRNAGRKWCKKAEPVLAHDWPEDSIGRAVPYGIYEVGTNFGYVCVGDCFDTPRFAVDAIADWWCGHGCRHYRDAQRLLILADAGGSNSYRSRVWKAQLQELCDACRFPITVCHYPPGCSKWNPIEHRLFSHISLNWAGVPLRGRVSFFVCEVGLVDGVGEALAEHDSELIGRLLPCLRRHLPVFFNVAQG